MKKLHPTSQFKRDFKKYRLFPSKVKALEKILNLLIHEEAIPKEYNAHTLKGQYEGCMECHIEGGGLPADMDRKRHH